MKRSMAIAVMMVMVFGFSGLALGDMKSAAPDEIVKIQQVRSLMQHALGMVTEGSSLVMVAMTNLAPPTDRFTAQRGMEMIESGKEMVQKALGGDEMMSMGGSAMKDDPMMTGTSELGEAILKYIEIVENLDMSGSVQDRIKMHHLHVMINHAMDTAAEGANLVLLGRMDLAGSLDKYTVDNGRMMLNKARATLVDVSKSETMMEMHEAGMGPEKDPGMAQTHNLLEKALKIIDVLEKISK